ncbi:MAG: YjjG family noncanonical pyrimidine nucleotidase [Bacteroidota bacterium]
MKYDWIFFDADDTLFDFKKSAHHAMAITIDHFKINPPKDYYSTYKSINSEVWAAFERNEITAQELRFLRFDRFLKAIGEYRDPLEMNSHYLYQLSQTDFMIDGARELMEELLAKKYRLCLITNGLKEVQRPRIAKAAVGHFFEGIVVSDEIGVSKPHTGFFEYAFSATGQPDKDRVIVVGDSLNSDIQGGNNFGIDTCWFNPNMQGNLTNHQPTYEISQLQQLKKLII